MNITVLFCSPHPEGDTNILLNTFLSALPGKHTISRYDSYSITPKPCIGCMCCQSTGECVYSDLDDFFSSALECDLLIIASPVYFRGLPSPAKAIIDRTQRFYHLPAKERKTPCVLLVCGGAPHADARIITAELNYALPCLGAVLAHTITAAGTDTQGISNEAVNAARSAAALVYDQLNTNNIQEETI